MLRFHVKDLSQKNRKKIGIKSAFINYDKLNIIIHDYEVGHDYVGQLVRALL